MTSPLQAGLLVLHGNRAELLAEALIEWTRRHPLAPLEQEVVLVQSNGMAEWLKMTLASRLGVCAATQVELPGRFLWRAYRQVLGREAVPPQSALDKQPLTWRLMACLPGVLQEPGFEPLAGFLDRGDAARRLQLAERLADLYDQYQVYRSDWLVAWAAGQDVLPAADGRLLPLPADQRWQPLLWRALLATLDESERLASRAALHGRVVAALESDLPAAMPLPRRVLLFGMTHVPMQTLQALAALSRRCQVVLAIPNPCRYHWADTIDGRELLRLQRRRQPLREGRDLAAVSLEQMHAHAHPLLAAWGRQGRDFVRQLDAFDDVQAAQARFALNRVDLFDDGPGETLLQQVQARIRDLVPLAEHPALASLPPDPADRSIVFHSAHSAQREVEVLHDQLLALLAQPPGGQALAPRDIVVMVPDIEGFAPAIRSVFGQHARGDARHIPYDIADLAARGQHPLLRALDWLLRLPQQRCRASELRDLLDVPAVAARFGVPAVGLPTLARWIDGAGIRWGLNEDHREALGLGACGDLNSWRFGLERMLLGYTHGDPPGTPLPGLAGPEDSDFRGVEPYGEVGGLEAGLAGALVALVEALGHWWQLASTPATPEAWAERLRDLLEALFAATDEAERPLIDSLHRALADWLGACGLAGFDEALPLPVLREAWLGGLDAPALGRRFRAGGVTFCTLLPMRAIPFEVVCLLGMNDGDYPRSGQRSDFDLMALPGQQRPGDRSRRDDDRQLMLEALLSARRVLHVSWTGRSLRDNSPQPPSVLVSQLRDYLAAGWGPDVLHERSTEHPLQPFSRRYFEQAPGSRLFTFAAEWRQAHQRPEAGLPPAPLPAILPDPAVPLTRAGLARFLKNPVREFFRTRLDVVFHDDEAPPDDDEAFSLDALEQHGLFDEALGQVLARWSRPEGGAPDPLAPEDLEQMLQQQFFRFARAGRLPLGELGVRCEEDLSAALLPMLLRWQALHQACPLDAPRQPLQWQHATLRLDDWLDGLRSAPLAPGLTPVRLWIDLQAGRLCAGQGAKQRLRADKLIPAWVRSVAASACGHALTGWVIGRDTGVVVEPLPQAEAAALLSDWLGAWQQGMSAPLPVALDTALAFLAGQDPVPVYEGGFAQRGEVAEPCLARLYPDFERLAAGGQFEPLAERLYRPLAGWLGHRLRQQPHPAAEAALAAGGEHG